MEEDIKLLEKINITTYGTKEELEALEIDLSQEELNQIIKNLINKYKEQEKHIEALDSVVVEHIEKSKEQEKIIELMAKELAVCGGFDYVEFGMSTGDFNKDIKNMIDYFKKKAKGE